MGRLELIPYLPGPKYHLYLILGIRMELPYFESSEVPLPPQEVRIEALQITPLADGRRVRVNLEVSPFQQPPNLGVSIRNASGEGLASADIIEANERKMMLTLHLREAEITTLCEATVVLRYEELGEIDQITEEFRIVGS